MHDVVSRILKRRAEHAAEMVKTADSDIRDIERALRTTTDGDEIEALDELKEFIEQAVEDLTEDQDELASWLEELE